MDAESRVLHKQLCYCNICENQNEIVEGKSICKLTMSFPEFEMECPNFCFHPNKFLALEMDTREDIRKSDIILKKNTDYYNDDHWESYEYVELGSPMRYIQLPEEYLIRAPIIKNLFISGSLFGFIFIIFFALINQYHIHHFLGATISLILGMVPSFFLYDSLLQSVSLIILNKNGIRFKGKHLQEIGWDEILFFFVKKFQHNTKGGVSVTRYFKMNYISGYSELFLTEDFLTDSKSAELLEWASEYHQKYWAQFLKKSKP
jgi:hypothetical protein